MGRVAGDPVERYLAKVDRRKPGECWPWTAACFTNGYGAFRLGQKQVKAHRFGFQTFVGPIPEAHVVCHTCDNPPCQNPAHWFSGTNHDNVLDRTAKGRGAVGLRNGGWQAARFTPTEIRAMRLLGLGGVPQGEIARRFETDQTVVSGILRRKTWAHLDLDLPAWTTVRRFKVTPAVVDAVLGEYEPGRVTKQELGDKYGVSRRTISMILDGWRPERIDTKE